MDDECPVCMEPLSKLCVQCPNGHRCCEKHFLQIAKGRFENKTLAYNEHSHCERCFVCRQLVPQEQFSDTYNKNRCIVIAFGMAKLYKQPQRAEEVLQRVQKINEEYKQRSSACQS